MRLIDVDALIEDLKYDVELDNRLLDDTDYVGLDRTLTQLDKDCKQNVIELLKNTPTAQPEPCEDCVSRTSVIRLLHSGYHRRSMIDEVKELPSVQLEPVRINLNELIKAKLTDWGKEIYYHQYDRTNQIAGREICKPKFPKEDENGYTEFQLWCFIELYGEHMGMTLPNVIEPLEIVCER